MTNRVSEIHDFPMTKADLKELELRLEARFDKNDGDMLLLKWMMGFVLSILAALVLLALKV